MATVTLDLLKLCIVMLLISMTSGVASQSPTAQKTWCIAKPATSDSALNDNIQFVCSMDDCRIIQSGGACFNPNTPMAHAAVVMNLYYQSRGKNPWNCDFLGSGILVITDPSQGACKLPS